MKSKSQHYSSWGGRTEGLYQLTDDDVEKLHSVLLNMYKTVNAVCERNNIHLIAAGGTALGAIRHQGFIPWDDDMDLFIFREEFEKFKTIFAAELGNEFYLLAPGTDQGANCFLPRIVKKNTTLLGMIDESAPYPHGIYIDLNVIEYAPENKALFQWKSFGADARRFISYSVYWRQYQSKSLKAYMQDSKGALYYRLRMALGGICSFRSAESWFASFDQYVQGKRSSIYTVPSGTKKYAGERLSSDVIFPLKKTRFEDTEIYVFNNYDWYLSNLYGDYMTVPKKENREHHMCLKLSFTEE